jgi:hypothetical protein
MVLYSLTDEGVALLDALTPAHEDAAT